MRAQPRARLHRGPYLLLAGGRVPDGDDDALRYTPARPLVFRGAVSTGFRAPSLGQSWFSAVSTNFVRNTVSGNVEPFDVWTAPVSSPIAVALGATPLRPETSRNYSGGAVWQPMSNLEMTADYFHIDIKHRIVLSGNFTQPQVQPILQPFGATGARFFTNAINTRTNGYDLVVNCANWSTPSVTSALVARRV